MSNCQSPSYHVGPNFNSACTSLPNVTGNGNFLIIDNSGGSKGNVYRQTGVNLPAGDYILSFRSATRHVSSGNSVALAIHFGTNNPTFSAAIPLTGNTWTDNQYTFTVSNGNTSGAFIIEQTAYVYHLHDYIIDDIVLTRLGPCELDDVTISFTVDGDDYCFTANTGTDPGITSYDFNWNFGGGATATGNPVCHTFADGENEVCVTVDAFSGSTTEPCDTKTVCRDLCVVNEDPPCTCGIDDVVASMSQIGCSAFLDLNATFNECTNFTGANIFWGDGTVEIVSSLPYFGSHNYSTGTYTPSLIINASDGSSTCSETRVFVSVICGRGKMAPGSENDSETLELFPSPTSGQLTVRHSMESGSVMQVVVTSVDGRQVFRQVLADFDRELKLDLSALPSGLYNLQLRDWKGKTMQQKFVVQ